MKNRQKKINFDKIIFDNIKEKKFLVNIFTFLAFTPTLYFFVSELLKKHYDFVFFVSAVIFLSFVNLFLLNFKNTIKFSIHFFVFLFFIFNLLSFIFFPFNGAAVIWYLVFPPISFLLLGLRKGLWISALLIFPTLLICFFSFNILKFCYSFEYLLNIFFAFAVLFLLIYVYQYQKKSTFDKVISINKKLIEQNDKLEELNRKIQLKQEKYTRLLSNFGDGFVALDLEYKIKYANEAFAKIVGYSVDDLIDTHIKKYLNNWNYEKNEEIEQKILKGKKVSLKLDFVTFSGKIRNISAKIYADYDQNNNVIGGICVFKDITEKIKTQRNTIKLNNELNKFYTIIEQLPITIVITNLDGNIEYVNPFFTKLTGYSKDEVIGKNPKILKSEVTKQEIYDDLWTKISNGKIWEGEFTNKKKNGELFVEKCTISPVFNLRKQITNYIAVKEDVTVLKKIQSDLIESRKRFFDIIEFVQVGIVLIDAETHKIETINKRATQMFGYEKEKLIGEKCSSIFTDIDCSNCPLKSLNLEKYSNDAKIIDNTGREYTVYKNVITLNWGGKKYFLESFVDITEITEYQEIILKKNSDLKKAKKKITDSLMYTKMIQRSIFPDEQKFVEFFKDYFLIFMPVGIVSGDFYFIEKVKNFLVVAVTDCTGHGVPGGFISILGYYLLHDIIKDDNITSSADALEFMRRQVKNIFKEYHGGMDINLCVLNLETGILEYAGAHNSLLILRNSEMIEVKSTPNPIGYSPVEIPFKNNQFQLIEDDNIYLFSDGFHEQLGKNNDNQLHKFTKRAFKNLLVDISDKKFDIQKQILTDTFTQWRGDTQQLDDVTILALKYKQN